MKVEIELDDLFQLKNKLNASERTRQLSETAIRSAEHALAEKDEEIAGLTQVRYDYEESMEWQDRKIKKLKKRVKQQKREIKSLSGALDFGHKFEAIKRTVIFDPL